MPLWSYDPNYMTNPVQAGGDAFPLKSQTPVKQQEVRRTNKGAVWVCLTQFGNFTGIARKLSGI